jgi:ABC-type hemin transport system ATPase subunit
MLYAPITGLDASPHKETIAWGLNDLLKPHEISVCAVHGDLASPSAEIALRLIVLQHGKGTMDIADEQTISQKIIEIFREVGYTGEMTVDLGTMWLTRSTRYCSSLWENKVHYLDPHKRHRP